MQKYQSHKVVEAAKIKCLVGVGGAADFKWQIHFVGASDPVLVTHDWVVKHSPRGSSTSMEGGYFVRYPGGYASWLPAEAFEEGYTRVPGHYRVLGDDGKPVENLLERLPVVPVMYDATTDRIRPVTQEDWNRAADFMRAFGRMTEALRDHFDVLEEVRLASHPGAKPRPLGAERLRAGS